MRYQDWADTQACQHLCCSHATRSGFLATLPKKASQQTFNNYEINQIGVIIISSSVTARFHPLVRSIYEIDSIKSQVSMKEKRAERRKKGH